MLNSYEQSMFGQVRLYACRLSPEGTGCWSEEGPGISGPFFLNVFSVSYQSIGKTLPCSRAELCNCLHLSENSVGRQLCHSD